MIFSLVLLPSFILWQSNLALASTVLTVEQERLSRAVTELNSRDFAEACDTAADHGQRALDAAAFAAANIVGRAGRENPFNHGGIRSGETYSRGCHALAASSVQLAAGGSELDAREAQYRRPWERLVAEGAVPGGTLRNPGDAGEVAAATFFAAGSMLLLHSRTYANGRMRAGPQSTSVTPFAGVNSGYGLRVAWQWF